MGTRSRTIDKRGQNLHTRAARESNQRHKIKRSGLPAEYRYGTRAPGTKVKFSDETVYTVFPDGSWRRPGRKKKHRTNRLKRAKVEVS